ncbi:MAG TPA: winged helix-turn-helix domain-containing protein [Nitrososphaera sp.]|jgi:predicted transcriptional regulator
MTDLILETHDKFVVFYDLAMLVEEGVASADDLASLTQLSSSAVNKMLEFMLAQGYIRTGMSDREFKITALGSQFLKEFEAMRRFLS